MNNNGSYEVECTNCGEILVILDEDINGDSEIYYTCPNCNYDNEIEIIYDINDKFIVELRAY